jgi:hypothetical protein
MKPIVIASLFLNLITMYQYIYPSSLTLEYKILFHAPVTVCLVAYLFYIIVKGKK